MPSVRGGLRDLPFPTTFVRPGSWMADPYNAGWIAFGVPGTESVAGTATPTQRFAQARRA